MPKKRFPYKTAFVACNGNCRIKRESACIYGCVGCYSCEMACRFDAIHVDDRTGVAKVDMDKCMACGMCAKVCPQGIITIREEANYFGVKCSNKDKGADARKVCDVSCIGCGMCERTCTAGAIKVKDNVAIIRDELCLNCGMCAVKCPRHAIHDNRGILTEK